MNRKSQYIIVNIVRCKVLSFAQHFGTIINERDLNVNTAKVGSCIKNRTKISHPYIGINHITHKFVAIWAMKVYAC